MYKINLFSFNLNLILKKLIDSKTSPVSHRLLFFRIGIDVLLKNHFTRKNSNSNLFRNHIFDQIRNFDQEIQKKILDRTVSNRFFLKAKKFFKNFILFRIFPHPLNFFSKKIDLMQLGDIYSQNIFKLFCRNQQILIYLGKNFFSGKEDSFRCLKCQSLVICQFAFFGNFYLKFLEIFDSKAFIDQVFVGLFKSFVKFSKDSNIKNQKQINLVENSIRSNQFLVFGNCILSYYFPIIFPIFSNKNNKKKRLVVGKFGEQAISLFLDFRGLAINYRLTIQKIISFNSFFKFEEPELTHFKQKLGKKKTREFICQTVW